MKKKQILEEGECDCGHKFEVILGLLSEKIYSNNNSSQHFLNTDSMSSRVLPHLFFMITL